MSRLQEHRDDDAVLVARLADDDQTALGILFTRHSFRVYGFARSLVRRDDDAQEIVQQTFLTLWENRKRLDLYVGSALPWLLVAARNHGRNLLRARDRHEACFESPLAEHHPAPDSDPADIALVEEAKADLNGALASLRPLDRQIFELCIEGELLYKEAATQLGLSHGAVRNKLLRVRQQLRARLGSRNGAPIE